MAPSHPEVFIIESLSLKDEEHDRLEGQRLASMLRLSGKKCRYFYIRTERELRKVMRQFEESEYRYLHVSCHGNSTGLATTFDDFTFPEFHQILNPYVSHRRVFLSACEAATPALARGLLDGTECYSVMGPHDAIRFDCAALFWASFYHLMFRENVKAMKIATIRKYGDMAAKMFKAPMNLFSWPGDGDFAAERLE